MKIFLSFICSLFLASAASAATINTTLSTNFDATSIGGSSSEELIFTFSLNSNTPDTHGSPVLADYSMNGGTISFGGGILSFTGGGVQVSTGADYINFGIISYSGYSHSGVISGPAVFGKDIYQLNIAFSGLGGMLSSTAIPTDTSFLVGADTSYAILTLVDTGTTINAVNIAPSGGSRGPVNNVSATINLTDGVSSVPIPASLPFLAFGLSGLALAGGRKRKSISQTGTALLPN